jgi:hypothetical protein
MAGAVEFSAFSGPGCAAVAISLAAEPVGGRTELVTEREFSHRQGSAAGFRPILVGDPTGQQRHSPALPAGSQKAC